MIVYIKDCQNNPTKIDIILVSILLISLCYYQLFFEFYSFY